MKNFYKIKYEIKKMFWNRERAVTLFFLPVAGEQYVYVIKYVISHTPKRLLIITILGVTHCYLEQKIHFALQLEQQLQFKIAIDHMG